MYAIIALLLTNATLIALDVSRSYAALGIGLGLPRPVLPGISDADVDRVVRLLTAGGFLVVAVGIWTLRRWAWVALMITVGLGLGEGLFRYARGEPRYVTMLINVLIVFYLNQRSVQRLFRHDPAARTPA
ncbi:MAG: hypothetical protein IRZ00_10580 [Gemmatimonadetes bacterium]|nr:hypothetical protein [Gemmatimonadota bacterium]